MRILLQAVQLLVLTLVMGWYMMLMGLMLFILLIAAVFIGATISVLFGIGG